jgi:branched-chain amino acid transport system permease protein
MNVLQQLANGVMIGHSYALVAIGWTLLLGAARLVNFGHGTMYMLGAFTAWGLMRATGMPYLAAIPCAVLLGALLGALMQRIMIRLTLEQNLVSMMIVTLGFGQIFEGGAGLLFGAHPQRLASPLSDFNIQLGPVWFTAQDLSIVVVAILLFAILHYVLARTLVGSRVRMVAEDPKLMQLAGVDVARTYLGIFAFEGAAVFFAATMIAPRTPILTSIGFEEVIITFVVVVLGGVGSVAGSYVAGLALGLFTAIFGAVFSPAYTTAAAFVVLTAVLVIRPGGFATGGSGR